MTEPRRPDDIARAVADAKVLRFPRAAVPAETAPPPDDAAPGASASDDTGTSSRDDEAGREDAGFGSARRRGGGGPVDLGGSRLPLTDLGNAERFVLRQRERLCYCPEIGWLAWDGRRWNRDGAEEAVKRAEHDTVRAIQREARALKESTEDVDFGKGVWLSDKVRAWGRASESAQRMSAISKRASAMLAIAIGALDAHPMLINVLNGTLEVGRRDDGDYVRLRPHDPDDGLTKLCPVAYRPDAACPLYDRFLDEVQPPAGSDGAAMQRFLHQWGGLALTGETGEQKMVFCYGSGRNGKGVWINTVAHIVGDYADSIQIESFLDSGRARAAGQATPDLAGVVGIRFLTATEPKKGSTLDESLIKQFTGEDPIKARFLQKDYFKFWPVAKLTLQGNYRPTIKGTDEGIWSRMLLVPWPIFIAKKRRDKKLAEKLRAEASGILNRLLDGLRLWLDAGLIVPKAVESATAEYRSDSDPLGRFLAACTEQALGQRIQSSDLYLVYEAWAKANAEAVWSAKGFGAAMQERGIPRKKSDLIYWLDLRLTKAVHDFVDAEGRPLHRRRPAVEDEEEEEDPSF